MATNKKVYTPRGKLIMAGKAAAAKARAEAQALKDAKHSPAYREAKSKVNKLSKKHAAARAKRRMPKEQLAQIEAMVEARQKKHDSEKKVQVTLVTFHNINGVRYGPGTVWVPSGLVLALLEQDHRALQIEANLYITNSHMLSHRGNKIQVATPSFEQIWAGSSSPIFNEINCKGITDVGQGTRF